MTDAVERIRNAFERSERALSLKPSIGQGTAVTRVRVIDGLACEVEEGPWKLLVDMSPKAGGTGAGPNPGVLGRAALGSCLAVGYGMWAAKLGVPISKLEVEVQADYDTRAEFGVGDVAPGYRQVRCVVTIESEAPEAEVVAMVERAEAHSSYLAVFSHPQDVRRELRVSTPPRA